MAICKESTLRCRHGFQMPSRVFLTFLMVLLYSNLSLAANFKEITAPELKQLTDSTKDFLLINVLSEIEYSIQHITGSINIPINKMKNTDKLPEDKNVTLVFYCLSER